jgi:hypothetical protein
LKKIPKERKPGLTSIIVLTSDQFSHTKRCIKSIRKNTTELHEIIAMDNGSSVKTTSWLRKQANEGKDIKVIGNPPFPKRKQFGDFKKGVTVRRL